MDGYVNERKRWWEHEVAKWNALAGKTIARVESEHAISYWMRVHFTDGTSVYVQSQYDEGWEILESHSDALPETVTDVPLPDPE